MALVEMMEEERNRLQKKLEEIAVKRTALDQEEDSVKVELSALAAYFDTKLGKVTTRQATNTKKTRAPRSGTSVKQQVLDAIKAHPHSITKQTIIDMLNAADNKSLQNGISNALVQLKKSGDIVSGERGSYKLPDLDPAAPAEPKVKRVKKEDAPAS